MAQRPPYIAIGLLSAGTLALEIVLMRLLAIIQWHHFAYLVIGLALLGYGISGTLITLTKKGLLKRYNTVLMAASLLFALSAVHAFRAAQAISFNPEELIWDPAEALKLAAVFLVLTLPFFFSATAVCLTLQRFQEKIGTVYAVDLFGAGIGSLLVVVLLYVLFPAQVLVVVALMGIAAAVAAVIELQLGGKRLVFAAIAIIPAVLLVSFLPVEIKFSPYKDMVQLLRIDDTEIIHQRSSPLGLLSVVESRKIPLRHAPGLSLNTQREPLEQLGVFTDGGSLTAITRFPEEIEQLSYMDDLTSAAVYHFLKPEKILIAGAGGGADVLQAIYHQAPDIHAVELNPQLVDIVTKTYGAFSGNLYNRNDVTLHNGEVRDYLTCHRESYDLIQVSLLDGFLSSSSGLHALHVNYLYTIEALGLFLDRLQPRGCLSITRWVRLPPRGTIRLLATAIEALRQAGVDDPENRIVLIRNWQTSTLIVKNGTFSQDEKKALLDFCKSRSFDIAYMPGMSANLANRYNILEKPYFFHAARSLLSVDAETFLDRYKFNVAPPTDDRPYFFQFFKWNTLPEIVRLRSRGGLPLMEWGYPALVATLLISLAASTALVLLPLLFSHVNHDNHEAGVNRTGIFVTFAGIGLAFLLMEIAFMQKMILLLKHPIYSGASVLAAFLVFAGAGSFYSSRLNSHRSMKHAMTGVVCAICIISLIYMGTFDRLFMALMDASMGVRLGSAVLLVAPLAFCMGFPFPLALMLTRRQSRYLPWAWGINGCSSVVGASLGTLLAVHFGFITVVTAAVSCYGVALVSFLRLTHRQSCGHSKSIHRFPPFP